MNADHGGNDDVRCDKCGAPVTTGLMAVFCPHEEECEFFVPDRAEEIAEMREAFNK